MLATFVVSQMLGFAMVMRQKSGKTPLETPKFGVFPHSNTNEGLQAIPVLGVETKLKNRKIPVGIGIPADILKRIDKEREDIPRSVYVTKLLQQALKEKPS